MQKIAAAVYCAFSASVSSYAVLAKGAVSMAAAGGAWPATLGRGSNSLFTPQPNQLWFPDFFDVQMCKKKYIWNILVYLENSEIFGILVNI